MKITVTHGFRGLLKPSKDQETLIIKTFGCCRKLWNLRLENILKDNPDYLSIPQYKQLYPYMKEVDSLALVGVERNQIQAFKNFKLDKSHFSKPKFKSKYAPVQSYTTCNQKGTVRFEDDKHIKIPKLGVVKCKMFSTLPPEYKLTFATISRECDGKYYISLTITYKKEIEDKPLDITMAIGLFFVFRCGGGYSKRLNKSAQLLINAVEDVKEYEIIFNEEGFELQEDNFIKYCDISLLTKTDDFYVIFFKESQ